jgi:2-iminobutanoate/2-iminopropanoate deaminase
LENVVKTTVFLKDLACFSEFNEVYQQFFETDYPGRSCVEIEVIAIAD